MRKTFSVLALTLLFLAAIDLGVAALLGWAERHDRLGRLVQYFEYGRSVPGKIARWERDPDVPGNLLDVAWRVDGLAISAQGFGEEERAESPTVRAYGMSFAANILRAAQEMSSGFHLDNHAGPGAPPNYVYALFLDDRASRRAGDVVVLGLLSSSVPAMAALTNSTWAFEQPAPFTYPIFYPESADGLRRTEPVMRDASMQRRLGEDPGLAAAWATQLTAEDAFYGPSTFGAVWLDASPFARLVRRSLATSHVARIKQEITSGAYGYPYAEVLKRMVAHFARIAREDGQLPVVFLIQTPRTGADLLALLGPNLKAQGIPYLATAEIFDPSDPSGFLPDGHYRPEIDRRFGEAFLGLLDSQGWR